MKTKIQWVKYTPARNVSKHIRFLLEVPRLKGPKDLTEFTNLLIVYKTQCGVLRASTITESLIDDPKLSVMNEMIAKINYKNLFESKEFLKQLTTVINEHKKIIRKMV